MSSQPHVSPRSDNEPESTRRPLHTPSAPDIRSATKITILPRFSITCPYHADRQWRQIRDTSPEEWADVVAFDQAIRGGNARANASGNRLLGEAFLHRSRMPLGTAPIDRRTHGRADRPNKPFEDGCSPWSCRADNADDVPPSNNVQQAA